MHQGSKIGAMLWAAGVVAGVGLLAWMPAILGAQKNSPSISSPKEIAAGRKVFQEQCEVCHYTRSAAKKIGPGLKAIYKRGTFAGGKKVDDAAMREWIEKGGKDMPSFKDSLKPDEIRQLIAYLKTL